MTLKVISADQIMFEGEVSMVTLPGELGSFTVLKNHASLISTLAEGDLLFKDNDDHETQIYIKGGIADIDNNVVSVCIY